MKITKFTLGLLFVLVFALNGSAQERYYDLAEEVSAFSIGKTVLANWSYDEYWYAGKIEKVSHNKYLVRFYDNELEWVTSDELTFFTIAVGDKIFSKGEGELIYKLAEVGKIEGKKVFVKYEESGETEWCSISDIRLK
jgi:hypothetical protein